MKNFFLALVLSFSSLAFSQDNCSKTIKFENNHPNLEVVNFHVQNQFYLGKGQKIMVPVLGVNPDYLVRIHQADVVSQQGKSLATIVCELELLDQNLNSLSRHVVEQTISGEVTRARAQRLLGRACSKAVRSILNPVPVCQGPVFTF